MRRQTDPDRVWRFCRYWQRTLLNKWNSREFVQRHGCHVPALYWCGTDIAHLPIESLPDCFAIRPVIGTARKGVYVLVGDYDLMSGRRMGKDELRTTLIAAFGPVARLPILVEEFVRSPKGECELPIEYKFHMFRDRVAVIEVMERIGRNERFHRQVDVGWNLLAEPVHTQGPLGGHFPPPDCIDEMLSCVRRLGAAFGTYVRVDYYASDKGAVFSEFSSLPAGGRHFTRFGDEYLGRMWDEVLPRET